LPSHDENPTSLYTTFVVFPVGASICKPFAEPTFGQALYAKNIPLLNQCLLILKTGQELYYQQNSLTENGIRTVVLSALVNMSSNNHLPQSVFNTQENHLHQNSNTGHFLGLWPLIL
jgi:hypothetical protein